jgi:glutathione S-transferase
MILIGQYDSPFTRRVAIALRLYGLAFEHRPWSTFGEGDKIAPFNPLRRVPTLVFEDGEVLIESTAILDYLDEVVGPSKAMIAENGPERRHALKICALATGLGDKAVSLIYERVLRKDASKVWVARCEAPIGGVLDALASEHRPRRHRGRLRPSIHRRGPSRPARRRTLSGAARPCRALRSAAAVCGDRAAAEPAERVRTECIPAYSPSS